MLEPVAASGDGDDFCVVEQAVEDGAGGGDVAQELAPFLDGAVGSHERGAVFIAAYDDFQEDFPALGRQDFESHVINDEQIGLEVAGQHPTHAGLGLFGEEFAHQIKYRAVEHEEPRPDRLGSDGLGEVTFANPGRSHEEHIALLSHELATGQLVNPAARNRGIEGEVEVLQASRVAEAGGFVAAADLAGCPHVEFVLEHEFQELAVGQPVGFGFLKAKLQAAQEPR